MPLDKIVQGVEEMLKDASVGAGVVTFFFGHFGNLTLKLLQLTDFGLDLEDALHIWETLVRTAVGFGTILVLWWRIKTLKKKYNG